MPANTQSKSKPSPEQESRSRRMSSSASTGTAIRRIRQACTACRHRKTKCSGDRPKCVSCRRVDRACHYEPYSSTNSASATSATSFTPATPGRNGGLNSSDSVNPDLMKRIKTIESQLARLSGQGLLDVSQMPTADFMTFPDVQMFLGPNETPANQGSAQFAADSPDSQRRLSTSVGKAESNASSQSRFTTLPPPEVTQSLVDTYFVHVHNQPYSYFHEESFRERLAFGLLPTCLVFALLASAARFSDAEYFRGSIQEATEAYAREAWLSVLRDHMTVENCPNLHVAQASNMLAVIDFTAGRTSSGWLKIGLAVRIAQDLELMKEPSPLLSIVDQEERRRAFWSIYLLDKLISCGQSRPPALFDEDCHVELPCDERDFRNGIRQPTPTVRKLLDWSTESESVPSNFSLTIAAASVLGRCARYVLHRRETEEILPWDSRSEFATLNSSLLLVDHLLQTEQTTVNDFIERYKSLDGTPDHALVAHIIFAHVLFHVSHLLLNHPFLLRLRLQKQNCKVPPSFLSKALEASCDHARKVSALLDSAATAGCPVRSSFYAYAAALAGSQLSLVIHAEQEKGEQPSYELVESCQQAIQILERMGQVWEHASRMHLQLLLFDSQGLSLAKVLDPNSSLEIDDQLEATLWSMVDYNTMSSSTGPIKPSLPVSVPDNVLLPCTLDFDAEMGPANDEYTNIMAIPNNQQEASEFLGQRIDCSL